MMRYFVTIFNDGLNGLTYADISSSISVTFSVLRNSFGIHCTAFLPRCITHCLGRGFSHSSTMPSTVDDSPTAHLVLENKVIFLFSILIPCSLNKSMTMGREGNEYI